MNFKKFVLSILSVLVLLFSFAPYWSVSAQATPPTATAPVGTWYDSNYFDWYGKVYDKNTSSEIFGERYTAAQVQWVIYSVVATILGMTGTSDIISCIISNSADIGTCAQAVTDFVATVPQVSNIAIKNQDQNVLSQIFSPDRPISGIGYVSEKINDFRLIPEAKAQAVGFGFSALSPIQDMWRGTRNVAFGLFVLASIIFAFMIMFRVKINPQTVITVQSAIPKVITALILVTFSYAIAGFLIDMMYVVIGLISVILHTATKGGTVPWIFNFLVYGQPLGTIQFTIFGFLLIITMPLLLGLLLLTLVILLLSTIPLFGMAFWILFIPLIIVLVMILWISIKTIWVLFKAFANIILLTIFGPLQIALGILIPNFGFGQWVKSYIAQLSVFVVTGTIGYLSFAFTILGVVLGLKEVANSAGILTALLKLGGNGALALGVWAGGIVLPSGPWPPLLGQGAAWTGLLFLGVSFVLFTMIPKATELVASFLAGKPFAYGSAIGEALGPINWAKQQAWNNTGAPFLEARKRASLETRIGDPNSWEYNLNKKINTLFDSTFKKKKELAN